jgi:hypothetical protein
MVRFEVFTAVTMKKAVFWDVAPFNVSDGRFACGFSYFPLYPEDGGDTFLRTVRLTPLLHGATSQKTAFFMTHGVCCKSNIH